MSYTGRQDAFVAKLSLDDGKIKWGTYYGGTQNDGAFSVTFAKDDYINFGGATYSIDLDVTPDAFQRN
ncbi:MAG: hypothetical protein N2517_09410, partial [Ignavibacteria bacterium]|nr:hypothetical protein [Ignavibacteria bacterium]